MELSVGKGIYTPIRAFMINDPNHIFGTKYLIDWAMDLESGGRVARRGTRWFEKTLKESTVKPVKFTMVEMNEARTYGCPGYFYLRGSLNDLRKTPYKTAIYMEVEIDGTNRRLSYLIYPHTIGYNIDVPTSVQGDDIQAFLSTTMDTLIAMPGITTPKNLDIPEYIGNNIGFFLSYPKRKKPRSNRHYIEIHVNDQYMTKCGGKTGKKIMGWMEDPTFDPLRPPMSLIPRIFNYQWRTMDPDLLRPGLHAVSGYYLQLMEPLKKITLYHKVRTPSGDDVMRGYSMFYYRGDASELWQIQTSDMVTCTIKPMKDTAPTII